MPSKALQKYAKTVTRCEILVKTYRIIHRANSKGKQVSAPKDMVRGSIVLSVAALDAYITDVFSEKLVLYLKKYNPDQSLIDLLSDAGLDTKEALFLINMDRPYRRIRTLITRYYDSYTTQRFDVIDKMFLPYRIKDITSHAEAKSGRKTLKKSVTKLIERRHSIVHDGDYNSHGKIVDVCDIQTEKRIRDSIELVKQMDEIICNRIK